MALSSQWSQAVVVKATNSGEVIVPQQPNNGAARAMAASGNPIIVRLRDAASFGHGGIGPNGTFADTGKDNNCSNSGAGGFLTSLVSGYDVSQTFWIPDPSRGEMGLLEHLARRGASNRSHVLLQSRPLPELQFNFSTCTGYNIDLSHNMFRLSKAAMALHHMDATLGDDGEDEYSNTTTTTTTTSSSPLVSGQLSISTRAFKATMRASLQSLQEEDYYLVRYRDYSAWAINEYRTISKTDSLFGRKYVEQCFAVHVGREPGELILMTEAQFLYGVDLLQRQLMNQLSSLPGRQLSGWGGMDPNQSSYKQYQIDLNYSAINADQFRSLGALLGDGMRQVGVDGEERKREQQAQADARARARGGLGEDYDYTPPAWYDWTPGAVRARVRHTLHHYYRSVGQLTVQLAVVGICGFLVYRTIRDYLPTSSMENEYDRDSGDRGYGRGRRGDRDGGRGRRGGRDYDRGGYDDDYYERRPGLLRSIFGGPKDVFDYILAPGPSPRHE